MRVDYEINDEFIAESLAAQPAFWQRRWRVQFWICGIISLGLASLLLLSLELVGPLLIGWLILIVLVGWGVARRQSPAYTVEPNTRQHVEVDSGCLTLGGESGWNRYHWAMIDGVRETSQMYSMTIGPDALLLSIPQAAFASATVARDMFTSIRQFQVASRKDQTALPAKATESAQLLEIEYPARDPFEREILIDRWAIQAVVVAVFLWLASAFSPLTYVVGPIGFLIAAWLLAQIVGRVLRRIAGRHIPFPGPERLVLTAAGIQYANSLTHHFVSWDAIGGATENERSIHIRNTYGNVIHTVPRSACTDSDTAESFFNIIRQNATPPDSDSEPGPVNDSSTDDELAELEQEFGSPIKIEKVLGFTGYPLLLIAFTGVWFFGLKSIAEFWLQRPDTVHLAALNAGYWIVPGMLLAFITGTMVVYSAWRLMLGSAFGRWMRYGSLVHRSNVLRTLILCLLSCAIVSAILIPLGLDCYVRATRQEIAINEFWQIGETKYGFDEIESIRNISFDHDGRQIPAYEIKFGDGSMWSSQGWIKEVNPSQTAKHRAIVEFVSERSGIEIRQAEPPG